MMTVIAIMIMFAVCAAGVFFGCVIMGKDMVPDEEDEEYFLQDINE